MKVSRKKLIRVVNISRNRAQLLEMFNNLQHLKTVGYNDDDLKGVIRGLVLPPDLRNLLLDNYEVIMSLKFSK